MKKTATISIILAMASASVLQAIPVKVGLYLQPPLTSLDKDQSPQGVCIDILKAAAATNDWTLTYVIDSRAGIMNKLWRKEIDLMLPAPRPLDRSENLDYTTTGIITSYGQIYSRDKLQTPSFQELNGKTVAVLRSDIHYLNLQEALKTASITCQFVAMSRYEDVLDAVQFKRVDVGLVDHFFGDNHYQEYELDPTPLVTVPVDFHFAVLRGMNRNLRQGLDEKLAELEQDRDSLFYKSLARWVNYHPPASSAILTILVGVGLLSGAIIIIVVVYQLRKIFRTQYLRLNAANRQLLKNVKDHLYREHAAENLKKWYEALLNNEPNPILVHTVLASGKPGKFIEANEAACLRLGYSREELLSLSPKDLEINAEGGGIIRYAKLLSQWRNARLPDASEEDKAGGAVTVELLIRPKNGKEIPAEVTNCIMGHDDQPVVFYSIHDTHSIRQAQRALKESELRFTTFFLRTPIGIALFDPSRKLTDVNLSALAMFGFSDRIQFSATQLLDSTDLSAESYSTLMKGGTVRYETVVDFDEARTEKRFNSAKTGKHHFDMLITNLGLDANFSPKGYMLQMQDVTDHRLAVGALRQHERILRQAQKMEAIGTLAGGIAHDFNNILTPILGYTEMAVMTVSPEDPIHANLEEVLKASYRAKELVKQILSFSRQKEQEVKPIKLIPLVKEVVQLLRGSVLANIELRTTIQCERDIVKADPTQIHQIIMNLCTNSVYSMREKGGILDVGMLAVTVDNKTQGPLSKLRFGDYVEIFVRDTGHGMSPAILDRIFEPFFTTKRSGEGTGMGLSVVQGIVTSLHGNITVESTVGKGTTFHIVLPLQEPITELTANIAVPLPKGRERVLIVDDEAGIVTMMNQLLASLGYRVTACQRPADALVLVKEDPWRFDLVITDQIMPGMTGLEMVKEIHRLRRNLPSILCTGFSNSISNEDLLDGGVREILMKPIVLRQMAEAIRRAVGSLK